MFDGLFEALAQAKSQPSKAVRAVQAGGQAVEDTIGGYMAGKAIKQQLEQYRLLSTPLGSMYSDPSQIPFGLSPSHTVKDLLTLAPAMENYIPASVAQSVFNSYTGGRGGNGGQPPINDGNSTNGTNSQGPSGPATPISTGIPSKLTSPPQTQGTSTLDADEGTGQGNTGIVPQGTPLPSTPVAGNSGASGIPQPPTLTAPAGGIGLKSLQALEPALNAGREGYQFNVGQANENERARLSREQQQRNFDTAQQNERNKTMAGETAKIAPSITEAGTIQDDINALRPLYKGYEPIPFMGTALANVASKSGSSKFGTQTMQTGKSINQIVPALSAKVNYLLNKRFNAGEASMLQQQVVPNASDDEQSANQKIANLQRLTAVMQGGDINALKMVASSIAGRPVNVNLPTSGNIPINNVSRGTGNPQADAAIARINASGLPPQAKQARINAVLARLNS